MIENPHHSFTLFSLQNYLNVYKHKTSMYQVPVILSTDLGIDERLYL